jgi:hypothetical protein
VLFQLVSFGQCLRFGIKPSSNLERAAAPRRQLEAENAQKNADFAAASKQQQQKYAEMIAKQDAAAARAHTAQLEEERRIATMREIERRYGRAKDQSR